MYRYNRSKLYKIFKRNEDNPLLIPITETEFQSILSGLKSPDKDNHKLMCEILKQTILTQRQRNIIIQQFPEMVIHFK